MRMFAAKAAVVAVLLLPPVASGQYLERNFYLPDSGGGVGYPEALTYDSSDNRVYVGGRGAALAIDGSSGRRLFRMPVSGRVAAIARNPLLGKVYLTLNSKDCVTVVDAATGRVLGEIAVGGRPASLCWNSNNNRVYCANTRDTTVSVIDCATDTVFATMRVYGNPTSLCYNPANQRVYCGSEDTIVTEIAGRNQLWVHPVPTGEQTEGLLCDSARNRVYCIQRYGVSVISGASHQVVGFVPTGWNPAALCDNPATNELYCANSGSDNVAVIDPEELRVTDMVLVGDYPSALVMDSEDNEVYCLNEEDSTVSVIDGVSHQVTTTLSLGTSAVGLVHNPADNRAYFLYKEANCVGTIDCRMNQVLARVVTGLEPFQLLSNPDRTRLYFQMTEGSYDTVWLGVFDIAAGILERAIPVGRHGGAMCYSSQEHKIYLAPWSDSLVTVIDARGDSVLTTIATNLGMHAIVYSPACDRVYVGTGYDTGSVYSIDCAADTVLRCIRVTGGSNALCTDPAGMRLYSAHDARVMSVIDCATDSVVAEVAVDRCIDALLYNDVAGKVYAQSYLDDGGLTVVDAQTNQVLARFAVGNGGHDMCLNPVNNKVYCTALYTLSVVDGAGDYILRQYRPGGYVGGVEYDPEYNRAYFMHTSETGLLASLLDGESDNIVGQVELGGGDS